MHEKPVGIKDRLELLMSGRGFNYYDNKNKARADDLLVRQRASDLLGDASRALTALEPEFRRRYVPAASRDNPYPPAEVLDRLRDSVRLRTRIAELETSIRSMSVPTQDKIWWRLRDEAGLLDHLMTFDVQLIQEAQEIEERVRAFTAESWNTGECEPGLAPLLTGLSDVIRTRAQLLSIQIV
ncbi:MAG: hypothetical protein ACLQVD_14340 [Capsulimonadaceae bacterium]